VGHRENVNMLKQMKKHGLARMVAEGPKKMKQMVRAIIRSKKKSDDDLELALEIAELLNDSEGREYHWCYLRQQRRDPIQCATVCADPESTWSKGKAKRIRSRCPEWSKWFASQGPGFDLKAYITNRKKLLEKK